MNATWLVIPAIGALLVGSMAGLSAARDLGRLSPELARKLLHVVMGLATLPLPWLFNEPTPVLLLAALAGIWFEAVRRFAILERHFGSVLSAVARRGRGEVHYAIGAAVTFVLADGGPAGFCLPIAILALADAAAALVGRRFGARPGAVRFGTKSLAGSVAFLVVAFAVSLIGLSIAACPLPQAVSVAVVLACATAVLEAVSRNGADNLLIPLGAALLLQSTKLPPEATALIALVAAITAAALALGSASAARSAAGITA